MSRTSPSTADAGFHKSAHDASPQLEPGLYVVATPIGNLRDITLRALDVLAGVDRIYAEDTRVTRKLLDAHGVQARPAAYNDHSDAGDREAILAALAAGARIALVSDAGTPLISDPGYKLVRAAREAGCAVFAIPGPSALIAALSVAGLPTDRFLFAGFPPTKDAARAAFFAELADVRATLAFYESGPRLADSLAAMAAAFPGREAAIARELTKLFETVERAPIAELAERFAAAPPPKGEIVVLIGPGAVEAADPAAVSAALRAALAHMSVRDAVDAVTAAHAVSRKALYALALQIKDEA